MLYSHTSYPLWSESGRLGNNFPRALKGLPLPPKKWTQLGSALGRSYLPMRYLTNSSAHHPGASTLSSHKPPDLLLFLYVLLSHSEPCTFLSSVPRLALGLPRMSACTVPFVLDAFHFCLSKSLGSAQTMPLHEAFPPFPACLHRIHSLPLWTHTVPDLPVRPSSLLEGACSSEVMATPSLTSTFLRNARLWDLFLHFSAIHDFSGPCAIRNQFTA